MASTVKKLFYAMLVVGVILLILYWNWPVVKALGFSETQRFFSQQTLKYNDKFNFNYPEECKMPPHLTFQHKEYFKVWFDIFNNFHDRPAHFHYHMWFKKIALNISNGLTRPSYFASQLITNLLKPDSTPERTEPVVGIITVTLVAIVPAILELFIF